MKDLDQMYIDHLAHMIGMYDNFIKDEEDHIKVDNENIKYYRKRSYPDMLSFWMDQKRKDYNYRNQWRRAKKQYERKLEVEKMKMEENG